MVEAALAAAESEATEPVNIGTGEEASVLDLVETLAKLGGNESFEPEFAPPRAGEVQRISLDASRAEELLGWRPTKSLEEGLRLTLDAV